jgi:hypothetical protein
MEMRHFLVAVAADIGKDAITGLGHPSRPRNMP